MTDAKKLDDEVVSRARQYQPWAEELLKEAIRIPADLVDRPEEIGGDPLCGTSNHEGPRLEMLMAQILEGGAVDKRSDVGFDDYGNLVWVVEDSDDGVAPEDKRTILLDGHSDTVGALRSRWLDTLGGGLDAYLGLTDALRLNQHHRTDCTETIASGFNNFNLLGQSLTLEFCLQGILKFFCSSCMTSRATTQH